MTSRHPTGNEEARHGECDMQLKEIVEYMAKALVDDIDNVDVQEIRGDQSSVIELRVSKADLGKVIGKQGQNAASLRTILNAVSAHHRRRVFLEIIE